MPDAHVLASRIEPGIDSTAARFRQKSPTFIRLAIRWEATLTPQETGEYNLGIQGEGYFRLAVDGKEVTSAWDTHSVETKLGRVSLEKGKPYKVEVTCDRAKLWWIGRLVWSKVDLKPSLKRLLRPRLPTCGRVVGIQANLKRRDASE